MTAGQEEEPKGARVVVECRRCGSLGQVITAHGLAFIVRCNGCGCQTGLERCEQDARDAWRKIQERVATG
jgi:uncharacterized Zn finger protein